MALSPDQIQKANELISQNRVATALTICLVPEATFLRDYQLINAGWSDLDQRELMGVLRPDDLQIERNKIIDRLLRLLTFEAVPSWKQPQSLLTKSRLPYAVLSVFSLIMLLLISWYFQSKPTSFPTVFAGYILSESALAPISNANVRLVDEKGVELSLRTYQADVNGYWIMKASEPPTSASKLIFSTPDCPGDHHEFYLDQLRESEKSSEELRIYYLSIDC